MQRFAYATIIAIGALTIAACSDPATDDPTSSVLSPTTTQANRSAPSTTAAAPATTPTTEPPVVENPAELALPYIEAIYLNRPDDAVAVSSGSANRYADFLSDVKIIRPSNFVSSAGLEHDITVGSNVIEYCPQAGTDSSGPRCHEAADFEFDDTGALKDFTLDGRPIGDRIRGPFTSVTAIAITEGVAMEPRRGARGVGFGGSDTEFVVRPKWAVADANGTTVVLALLTSSVGTQGSLSWEDESITPIDMSHPEDLIPLGYSPSFHSTMPFATLSDQAPIRFAYGRTSDDEFLFDLTFPVDSPLESFEIDVAPFTDVAVVHRLGIDFTGSPVVTTQFLRDPGATLLIEDLVEASYSSCVRITPDELIKAPREHDGECLATYASIHQYDSLTGSCAFLAGISDQRSSRSYDYIEPAWFGFGSNPNVFEHKFDCGILDGIDQNDIVEIWAAGAGTFSYQTAVGATGTVPALSILRIELIEKA
jgi:hypothetical protein